MNDEYWRESAACRGQTHLFFYTERENSRQKREREQAAKRLCEECPVRVQCRDEGRVNNEIGIWGGENEEDRYKAGYLQTGPYTRSKRFLKKYGRVSPDSPVVSDVEKV
jgi:WhiB family redox-sensing transcriptional regulator